GRSALGDKSEGALHLGTRPDDVLEAVLGADLGLEVQVLLEQSPPLQRTLNHKLEFVRIERLGQVVEGPEFHRFHGRFDLRQSGDHDDVDVRVSLFYPAKHLKTVDLRHHDVQDDDVVMVLIDLSQRLQTVLDGFELILVVTQDAKATVDNDPLVIDDQYFHAHELLPLFPISTTSGNRMRER